MMRVLWWPLCVVRWVPGGYVEQQPDVATGRAWFTRGQVRFFGLPVVLIAENYRNDAGLMAHELEHVAQFWRAWAVGAVLGLMGATWALVAGLPDWRAAAVMLPMTLHPLLYTWVRVYRAACEVWAYREQRMLPDRFGLP